MIVWGLSPPPSGVYAAGAVTSEGILVAATPAADNDVFVQGAGQQHRWNAALTVWEQVPPTENRADLIIMGGLANQRVTKLGTQQFRTEWASSAAGVMQMWNQVTATDVWQVEHGLTAKMIDVQVLSPGYSVTVPTQGRIEQPGTLIPLADQAVLIPDIEYFNANEVRLIFEDDVAGTAIIRR